MNNERDGISVEMEQARQFFTVAVEQAVTKAVEQVVNPRFDEQSLRMQEQNHKMEEYGLRMEEQNRKFDEQNHKFDEQNQKMEKLRTDMRIAISESNADRLKGTITISGLITGFGSAIAVGVCSIMVSFLK